MAIEGTNNLIKPLLNEGGGHRWQRVPPTERRGRVHTSTVTVAVFVGANKNSFQLRDADIDTRTTMDSGPGGQHRNKTESCVIMRHAPTGIEAKAASKSQYRNKIDARQVLEARVAAYYAELTSSAEASKRRRMVGSGMRGDKIKTYRSQDDTVIDHRSNKKSRLKDVLACRCLTEW